MPHHPTTRSREDRYPSEHSQHRRQETAALHCSRRVLVVVVVHRLERGHPERSFPSRTYLLPPRSHIVSWSLLQGQLLGLGAAPVSDRLVMMAKHPIRGPSRRELPQPTFAAHSSSQQGVRIARC